ncbi:MAG: disulfide bond formation protein DsbA [Ilumatobacteraceae bacterium]
MADLEFFLDPICPWAWITSRWVVEVQQLREYEVNWRFICLKMINEHRTEEWYTPEYRASHMAGLYGLRVADQARLEYGNEQVGEVYTALGEAIHLHGMKQEISTEPVVTIQALLKSIGLSPGLADAALDDSHDAYIRADTDLAFERTGKDVGTPIITFHPGQSNESSFFGPVIASIPRGEAALKLWDAVEIVATTSGMAELKRSNRAKPVFD